MVLAEDPEYVYECISCFILRAQNDYMVAAFKKIASCDYRGNEPFSHRVAVEVLSKLKIDSDLAERGLDQQPGTAESTPPGSTNLSQGPEVGNSDGDLSSRRTTYAQHRQFELLDHKYGLVDATTCLKKINKEQFVQAVKEAMEREMTEMWNRLND